MFHVPRVMDNLVIIEVKSVMASDADVRDDHEKLIRFLSMERPYQCGIQLVFGDNAERFEKFIRIYREANRPQLRLYWHRRCGECANRTV